MTYERGSPCAPWRRYVGHGCEPPTRRNASLCPGVHNLTGALRREVLAPVTDPAHDDPHLRPACSSPLGSLPSAGKLLLEPPVPCGLTRRDKATAKELAVTGGGQSDNSTVYTPPAALQRHGRPLDAVLMCHACGTLHPSPGASAEECGTARPSARSARPSPRPPHAPASAISTCPGVNARRYFLPTSMDHLPFRAQHAHGIERLRGTVQRRRSSAQSYVGTPRETV